MSTDMQQYSLENQSEAIALYAAGRGLTIVRSYEDGGKSGLRIDGRAALTSLINDVKSGRADFTIILVYDVSRWGRFQDSDESAYYEFICKQAGVYVEYCAEQFANDGSLMATVIKNIKRAMAGEFSRELSVKVHAGQSRIVRRGFYIGSAPGYGLRRFLLDEQGNRKVEMASGQRKSLHTEHTILVPGPPKEIEIIHDVYDMFIDKRKTLHEIVEILNARGVPNVAGRPWKWHSVRELLANEKYAGTSIYNRTSKKLGVNWRRNPRAEWVKKPGAFDPIVTMARFQAAQKLLAKNARLYTENELLDSLTAIWCRNKFLSRDIINDSTNAPSARTYQMRFGGLTNAYRRVGFLSARNANREYRLQLRTRVSRDIAQHISERGGAVEIHSKCKCELRINNQLNVTVVLGRASKSGAALDENQWQFGYRSRRKSDILVVARVDQGSSSVRDYFVLPFIFLPPGAWLTASGRNYSRLQRFHTNSLAPLYDLCARDPLPVE